jgi:hypothetical protein
MRRLSYWLQQAGLDPVSLRKMRAAALHGADAGKDGPTQPGGAAVGPTLIADAPAPSGSNESAGAPIGEATPASDRERQREEYRLLSDRSVIAPDLKLIAITGEPTHPRPCVSPARRVGSPVVVEGRAHATWP